MYPFEFFGEARQVTRCSDRARRASADIGEIGEIAFQLLLIFVVQRQMPGAIVRGFTGGEHLFGERIVVGKQAADHVAECDHAGASERGDIDHRRRFVALSIGERVAQD